MAVRQASAASGSFLERLLASRRAFQCVPGSACWPLSENTRAGAPVSGIFISHSSRDNTAADDLAKRLRAQGYQSLFLDFDPADGIPAGRHWEREIYAQLRACSGVVVLCSAHSMASDWCFAEITHARALGKQLFPLIIDACELRSVLLDTQSTDLRPDAEAGYARLWRGMRSAGLDPTDSFDWDVHRPPYPGLTPFQVADAAVYFGRDDDQRCCLDTLAQMRRYGGDRLLVLVGTSGSGKSSLVRAGVIPKLSRMPDWHVLAPMRPRQQPVDELARALPDAPRARLIGDASERALAVAAAEVAAASTSGAERRAVLLVVDQLEELVTISDAAAAARFVDLLRTALVGEGGDLYCLATLRADYLSALQSHAAWGQMPFREMSLGPMTPRHFAEIICKPAQVAGIELEPGLVETMVQDTGTADALPLLAFTLNRLWRDFGADGKITLDEYTERIGGLEGAIRQEADAVLAALKPTRPQISELRRAFRHMVRVDPEGQYTRRSMRWQEIPAEIHPLMEAFVKARLLVSGQEDPGAGSEGARTLEVAHEALFRAWDRLKRWLDEDRAFLLWRQHLRPEADAWQAAPKDQGLLLRGGPLAEAHRWLNERESEVDDTLRAFIAASTQAARRARRRWRALEAGIAIGFVAASWLGVKLWQQRLETHTQLINSYWSGAVSARDATGDALKAAHYFARVADLSPLTQARESALIGVGVLSGGVALNRMIALPAAPEGVRVRADDALLVSWSAGNATLHDLHSGAALVQAAHATPVQEAHIAAQRHVVSRDAAGGVWLWSPGQAARALASDAIAGIALDDDGRRLLGWHEGGVRIWSLPEGDVVHRLALTASIAGARFLGREGVLAWSKDGQFWQWRIGEAEVSSTWQMACAVRGVDIAADAGSVLSWCDATLMRHDFSPDGAQVPPWASPETVDGARIVPGGEVIVSWNAARGRLRLWNAATGQPRFDQPLARDSDDSISHVLVTPQGAHIITSGGGGNINLWDLAEGAAAARGRHDKNEATVSTAIAPDGTRVLAWSATAGARLWDTNTMTPLSLPLRHRERIAGAAFFDDGEGIVTWSNDADLRVWRRHPAAELTAPVSVSSSASSKAQAKTTVPDTALKARLDALGLHGYELLDQRDDATLVAAGPLARRLGADGLLSPPLTLNEGVSSGALLADGRIVLWGNTSVQLWDAIAGQPLSARLRSDVLYPESTRVDGGLLTSDGNRARQWRWPVPDTAGVAAQQWLAAMSATQMDAQGAMSVMTREAWCALVDAVPDRAVCAK
ncbi:TIR domain-containing protein [Denitromonas halophila]|uniref:TIR domain-containing protein n=1 Tax=Denitromonas halophila TaxID=1629404 RepID=A0A557QYT8_9RHOO|nr:TIR domain-containing protein [Denitromonas halophila]